MVFDTTYFFTGPMARANGIIQSGIPSGLTPVSAGLRHPASINPYTIRPKISASARAMVSVE